MTPYWQLKSRGAWGEIGVVLVGILTLSVLLTGCVTSQINKHANVLSKSLSPVISQSAVAYRDAMALHNLRGDYEAVVAYKNKDESYNPRSTPVLLSEKDIQARLAVLAALQVYSKSLIAITQGNSSADLDAASKSVGGSLTSLGNHLAPSIENVMGIAAATSSTTDSSTSSAPAPVLSPEVRNGISTAINALGQFLVNRTITKGLPGQIEKMDPYVQTFCKTLDDDIQTLDSLAQRDYDRILNLEKQFILEDEADKNVSAQAWRTEIMKLPEIAREQREAHERLFALREAIDNLALTHHALAAAAQNNSPESLQDKFKDLADAGSNLGKFYSALPTD